MNTFLFIVPPLHLFSVGWVATRIWGHNFSNVMGTFCSFYKMRGQHVELVFFFSISAPGHREQHLRYAPAHAVNVAFASWTWLAWSDMEYALWEATGLLGEAANVLMVQMVLGCLGHPDAMESGWSTIPPSEQSGQDKLMNYTDLRWRMQHKMWNWISLQSSIHDGCVCVCVCLCCIYSSLM